VPGQITALLKKYKAWLDSIDTAFDEVREAVPDAIPCHAGCSHCCYSLFAVPAIDGFLLWEGLMQQGQARSEKILTDCHSTFSEFKETTFSNAKIPFRIEAEGWTEFNVMVDKFQRPCPLLKKDGSCGIYAFRPRICRLAGTVFRDPATGYILKDYCPIAEESRNAAGFNWAAFNISEMDATLMEFKEVFQETVRKELGLILPSGMTFPVAGILEAEQAWGG